MWLGTWHTVFFLFNIHIGLFLNDHIRKQPLQYFGVFSPHNHKARTSTHSLFQQKDATDQQLVQTVKMWCFSNFLLTQSDLLLQQTKNDTVSKGKCLTLSHWDTFVLPTFLFIFSSADFAQPVVCLGVGNDGLNRNNGLVDLGLEFPQLLDVQ